jgi:hypothetical protein
MLAHRHPLRLHHRPQARDAAPGRSLHRPRRPAQAPGGLPRPPGQGDPRGLHRRLHPGEAGHPGSGLKIASRNAIRGGHRLDVVPEAELDPLPAPPPAPTPQQLQAHIEVKPPSCGTTRAPATTSRTCWNRRRASSSSTAIRWSTTRSPPSSTTSDRRRQDSLCQGVWRSRPARGREDGEGVPVAAQEPTWASMTPSRTLTASLMTTRRALPFRPCAGAPTRIRWCRARQQARVPGLGQKQQPGASVVGDANFFKQINDELSHAHGDAAIKAIGGAWRDAAAEVGQGKAHRFGGDEFHAHFPTYEHAANFARNLRGRSWSRSRPSPAPTSSR